MHRSQRGEYVGKPSLIVISNIKIGELGILSTQAQKIGPLWDPRHVNNS